MKMENSEITDEAVRAIVRYFYELFRRNPHLARRLAKEQEEKGLPISREVIKPL